MKTSELIKELSAVIAEHGDLPAFYFDGACTHEPAVTVALHRTGNETWIWEAAEQPLSESDADTILEKASLKDLEWARKTIGQLDRGNVAAAALILVRVQSIEKARRVLAMYGEQPGRAHQPNPYRLIVKETLLALKLARKTIVGEYGLSEDLPYCKQLDATILKAELFLADPASETEGRSNA